MSTINAKSVASAQQLRETWDKPGGVIVTFRGVADTWMNELRDPENFRPGVIAIDELGNQWVARGGNDETGAYRWEQIVYAPELSTGEL